MTESRAGGGGLRLGLVSLRVIPAYKENDSMFFPHDRVASVCRVKLQRRHRSQSLIKTKL